MKVALALPQLGPHVTRDGVRGFVERAEELGYGGLFAQQHLFYPHNPVSGYSARPGVPVPEPYRSVLQPLELLTAAAAWTEKAIIGTSILVAGYHRPVDLAARLATLDLLSGGRVVAGFSVGWSDEEHIQYDVDPRTRGRRADEMFDALRACWAPDPVEFHGEFFDIPVSDVRPKPLQPHGIRLASGMRSPAGLARTAEKFDIWNPASGTLEQHLETFAKLAEMRPEGKAPLGLHWNLFTQPPVEVANLRTLSVDELAEQVAAAAATGQVDLVSIDTNFDVTVDSPEAWATVPDRLLPVLEAGERMSDALARLVDERDVLDTVHRFAAGMDLRDWPAYRAVFADELVLDYTSYRGGEPVTVAADAWVERVRRRFATMLATQHQLGNHRIEVDGDSARCRTYVEAMHVAVLDGVEDWCLIGGEYDDLLRRTPNGWLIERKKLDVRWTIGNRAILDLPQT